MSGSWDPNKLPLREAMPPAGRPVILQVLPALVSGGAEQGTIDLARAIRMAGGTALVASAGGPMTRDLARAGGEHVDLPLTGKAPWTIWANAARLEALIRARRVDVVHARSRAPGWSAWLAAQRTGTPFITTVHAAYGRGGRLFGALKGWYNGVMARGERVIAISRFIADYVTTHHPEAAERVRVVHRGIDLARFDPERVRGERLAILARQWRLPEDRPVLLLPGRLSRSKGHAVLLEALQRLRRRDLLCLMVGSAGGHEGYRRRLEAEVRARGLEGVVHIMGPCADMPAAYMLASAVVAPSIVPEGFGRVPVEAQAMGRPIIATDLGAAREVVLDGQTGLLVPPRDPEALADALAAALDLTEAQRAEVAVNGPAHVAANFTVEHMTGQTLALYREVLEG